MNDMISNKEDGATGLSLGSSFLQQSSQYAFYFRGLVSSDKVMIKTQTMNI